MAATLLVVMSSAAKAAQTLPGRAQSANALPLSRIVFDAYILGPGDTLQVEVLDIPEFSGTFSIGPDGTMYLPRLQTLYVEGLTVEELRYFLTQQFVLLHYLCSLRCSLIYLPRITSILLGLLRSCDCVIPPNLLSKPWFH